MNQTVLATVIFTLLGEMVISCEDVAPKKVQVKLKNVNEKIKGKDICTYLEEELLMQGFLFIEITIDENDNLFVSATEDRNINKYPSRLTTAVLNLLKGNVIKYGMFLPNSITVDLKDSKKKYEGKNINEYLSKALLKNCFEKIQIRMDQDEYLTVFAEDKKDTFFKRSKLMTVVLTLLRGHVIESKEITPNFIAVNLIDCNIEILNRDVEVFLKERLLLQGFENIEIQFDHGNWLRVWAQERKVKPAKLSKLANTVLTALGNNVYEYCMFYPNSITINFVDSNGELGGKDLRTYLKDLLELQGFEEMEFYCHDGHWKTVIAIESDDDYYEDVDLATLVHTLLGDDILEYEEITSGFITMNLVDCRKQYGGKDVVTYLQDVLSLFGYKELQINFEDDNWLTIISIKPQTI